MQKAKLSILFAQFCYAGNGGVATVLPHYVPWFAKVYSHLRADERIGKIAIKQYGDIPLDIERNRVVKDAKESGFDVIVMLDSDNIPDLYLGHRPEAESFIDTSLNFLYEREIRGLPTVVCAPYCGPPPHPTKGGSENVYVFYSTHDEGDDSSPDSVANVRFEAYSREHAAIMRGIQSCAAGPTGCIMYSTSAFDLMPVHATSTDEILDGILAGTISRSRAKQLLGMESWFYYESPDRLRTSKSSTEDVTNTREIQFAGIEKHGEPVVFCNWDAWAGHYKPKCVGAPSTLKIENVSNLFREVVTRNVSHEDQAVEIDFTDGDPFPTPDEIRGGKSTRDGSHDYVPPDAPPEAAPKKIAEPPAIVKKETRLGVPVNDPMWTEDQLVALSSLVGQHKPERPIRCFVIGDITGELSMAVSQSLRATVYALRPCQELQKNAVRIVDKFDSDCQPQELDLVVVGSRFRGPVEIAYLFSRHVKLGGMMLLMTRLGDQEGDPFRDDTTAEVDDGPNDDRYRLMVEDDGTLGLTVLVKGRWEDAGDGDITM